MSVVASSFVVSSKDFEDVNIVCSENAKFTVVLETVENMSSAGSSVERSWVRSKENAEVVF